MHARGKPRAVRRGRVPHKRAAPPGGLFRRRGDGSEKRARGNSRRVRAVENVQPDEEIEQVGLGACRIGRQADIPPVRVVRPRDETHRKRGGRPKSPRNKDDALPDGTEFRDSKIAHQGGAERKAGHGFRGAQGEIRRGEEHLLGKPARKIRRDCHIRNREPQSPRKGDDDYQAGKRRNQAVRPPFDGELQREDGENLLRPRPSFHEPRDCERHHAFLQPHLGIFGAPDDEADCRRPDKPEKPPSFDDKARGRKLHAGKPRNDSREDERAGARGDNRRALRGEQKRREDSAEHPRNLPARAGHSGAEREHNGRLDCRAVS